MIECRLAGGTNVLVERKVTVKRGTENFYINFVEVMQRKLCTPFSGHGAVRFAGAEQL